MWRRISRRRRCSTKSFRRYLCPHIGARYGPPFSALPDPILPIALLDLLQHLSIHLLLPLSLTVKLTVQYVVLFFYPLDFTFVCPTGARPAGFFPATPLCLFMTDVQQPTRACFGGWCTC